MQYHKGIEPSPGRAVVGLWGDLFRSWPACFFPTGDGFAAVAGINSHVHGRVGPGPAHSLALPLVGKFPGYRVRRISRKCAIFGNRKGRNHGFLGYFVAQLICHWPGCGLDF